MSNKLVKVVTIPEVINILLQSYCIEAVQGFPTSYAYPKGPKYVTIFNGNLKEEGSVGTFCGNDIPTDTLVNITLKAISSLAKSFNTSQVYIRNNLEIWEEVSTYEQDNPYTTNNYKYKPSNKVAYIRVAFEKGNIV